MSVPVDSLLRHPLQNTPTETIPADQLLLWWSQSGLLHWEDENNNVFQEGFKVNVQAATYTVKKDDRNTILRSTGTANITVTIPADVGDAKVDLPSGSIITLMRTDTGGVDLDFSNITTIGPSALPAPYSLRLGEAVVIQKLNGSFWKVNLDPNKAFTVQEYLPVASKDLLSIGTTLVSSIAVPTSVWNGTIAVGTDTETSGGVFAASAGALTQVTDEQGNYLNAVTMAFNANTTVGSYAYLAGEYFSNTSGFLVGFLRTTATDGDTNTGANLFIDFALVRGFSVTATTLNGDWRLGLPIALAAENIPYTI